MSISGPRPFDQTGKTPSVPDNVKKTDVPISKDTPPPHQALLKKIDTFFATMTSQLGSTASEKSERGGKIGHVVISKESSVAIMIAVTNFIKFETNLERMIMKQKWQGDFVNQYIAENSRKRELQLEAVKLAQVHSEEMGDDITNKVFDNLLLESNEIIEDMGDIEDLKQQFLSGLSEYSSVIDVEIKKMLQNHTFTNETQDLPA